MKPLNGSLSALTALSSLLLIASCAGGLNAPKGDTAGPVDVANLDPDASWDVTVYRDKWGVPHIFSDSAPGLFYGSSYALAQDRLADFELAKRQALGQMAEIVGPSAIETDIMVRTLLPSDQELEDQFRELDPEYQRLMTSSYLGLRDYFREVRQNPELLPYEFKEWGIEPTEPTLWEYLKVKVSGSRFFGAVGGSELTNLAFLADMSEKYGPQKAKLIFDDVLPLQDPDAVPFIPGADKSMVPVIDLSSQNRQASLPIGSAETSEFLPERRGASRALLIGAKKSESGNPMILQATADGPDIHISGAGFDAAGYVGGWSAPVVQGRTPTFAWSVTTGEADMVDIFAEELNPENPRQYRYKGEWRDMSVRTDTIQVRGAEPVIFEIETTVHGPVIHREDEANTAFTMLNGLAGKDLQGFLGFIEMNRAKSLEDYKRASAMMVTNYNVNYAGLDGHIATTHTGHLPVRAEGVDPRLPTPGTGEYDWQGHVQDSPFAIDPEQGYIHVWNNKATDETTYGDTSRYGKTFRTWLGRSLAESHSKVSRDDLHEFHRLIGRSFGADDLTVTNPRYFTPYLAEAASGAPELMSLVEAIHSWNAIYEDKDDDGFYDNPGLPAYRAWIDIAQKAIIGDDIGDWWHKIDDDKYVKYRTDVLLRAIEGDDAGLPMSHDWFNGRDKDLVLRQTLRATLNTLIADYGSANVEAWQQPVFYTYLNPEAASKNPDKPGRVEIVDGQWTGPSLAAPKLGLQPAFILDNGSENWNMLVELDESDPTLYDATEQGGQNLFIGTDGKGNPNIADQIDLHINFEFKDVSLDRDRIVKEAVSSFQLKLPEELQD